jgi:hypothetical protein
VRYVLRAVRSVFSDEKKLSIAALSQTLRGSETVRRTELPELASSWNTMQAG